MTLAGFCHLALLTALSLISLCASAQQPPDVVQSDDGANTAMGTGALYSLDHSSGTYGNTAAGWATLNQNSSGSFNTAIGAGALESSNASSNTAVGYNAMGYTQEAGNDNTAIGANTLINTTGSDNTAVGSGALQSEVSGSQNTAVGQTALYSTVTGNYNVAVGFAALYNNYTGIENTADGTGALYSNTSGGNNTASGLNSLFYNTTGSYNTAAGSTALNANTTGVNNTAFGYQALFSNTTGKGNAAQGVNALYSNTTGIRNSGIGNNALYSTTGSYNIALGFDAGYYITTGSNNIEIGAPGTANDNNTIQIGVQGTQTKTIIAGINATQVTGSAVYVTSSGQLGVQGSSERFKTGIASMPDMAEKLQRLRPVTFHYRTDPHKVTQFGLIAEEVDRVFPELVIRDDAGRIMGIHYEELAPMLLDQMQTQRQTILAQMRHAGVQDATTISQAHKIETQAAEIQNLKIQHDEMQRQLAELNDLKQELRAEIRNMESNTGLVLQR